MFYLHTRLYTVDSGFISMPNSLYYDLYTSEDTDPTTGNTKKLSHGLFETEMWYGDKSTIYSDEELTWVLRGGFYGFNNMIKESGVFYFSLVSDSKGGPRGSQSFRMVISP